MAKAGVFSKTSRAVGKGVHFAGRGVLTLAILAVLGYFAYQAWERFQRGDASAQTELLMTGAAALVFALVV